MLLDICENSSVLNVVYVVKIITLVICIVVPIILMVSLMVKIVKEMTNSKEDVLENILKTTSKKMIATIALFMVPTIVGVLTNITPGNDGYLSCYESANPEYIAQKASEEKALAELNNEKYKEYNRKLAEEAERRERQRIEESKNASGGTGGGSGSGSGGSSGGGSGSGSGGSGGDGSTGTGDAGNASVGSYRTWKQYDPKWKDNKLGATGTIGSIGCTSTSVAIALAKSNVRTNLNTTLSPASFVNWMNNNGGYVGNLLAWYSVQNLAPSFRYQGKVDLSGTNAQKTERIKKSLDNNEYIIASVNNGGHWVFVDYVKDGKVYILDPGSSNKTELFQYGGVTEYAVYKVY